MEQWMLRSKSSKQYEDGNLCESIKLREVYDHPFCLLCKKENKEIVEDNDHIFLNCNPYIAPIAMETLAHFDKSKGYKGYIPKQLKTALLDL